MNRKLIVMNFFFSLTLNYTNQRWFIVQWYCFFAKEAWSRLTTYSFNSECAYNFDRLIQEACWRSTKVLRTGILAISCLKLYARMRAIVMKTKVDLLSDHNSFFEAQSGLSRLFCPSIIQLSHWAPIASSLNNGSKSEQSVCLLLH